MKIIISLIAVAAFLSTPQIVRAHCDTLRGPVVADALLALDTRDVTPVLKWIKPESESEIRMAFRKTLIVRSESPDAREIADRYFFETLVRLHRSGENAPFTGLKDDPIEPVIVLADNALESGFPDELVNKTTAHLVAELRRRFAAVKEAQKHSNDSVSAGTRVRHPICGVYALCGAAAWRRRRRGSRRFQQWAIVGEESHLQDFSALSC